MYAVSTHFLRGGVLREGVVEPGRPVTVCRNQNKTGERCGLVAVPYAREVYTQRNLHEEFWVMSVLWRLAAV